MSFSKQTFNVGGLSTNVYSSQNTADHANPVAVLFILHGRTSSAESIEWVAHSTLRWTQDHRNGDAQNAQDLFVVTIVRSF
ncbi:hypothetical protein SCP_1302590 [Sparassis crispa]|uniref:Phospholipase/carboxylesterase/thioesterase domain-containing protein n=1 Tax=Sparassis crispa TaxID=139825 RepID=A0A401H203_9APHY|nr:hypothetical protein SCP_1302590 [Sparassis crispa]GBE88444.1 hypothetical protein SCP_1302590 [Sparassis crispa]